MGMKQHQPAVRFKDNMGAIDNSMSNVSITRSRNIDIKYQHTREQLKVNTNMLGGIASKEVATLADLPAEASDGVLSHRERELIVRVQCR